MTSKHTLGRWKVAPQTFSIKAEQVGTVVYGNPDNPNREADACLIAAAPELLEALRHISEVGIHEIHDWKAVVERMQATALSAIAIASAKAEGRS